MIIVAWTYGLGGNDAIDLASGPSPIRALV